MERDVGRPGSWRPSLPGIAAAVPYVRVQTLKSRAKKMLAYVKANDGKRLNEIAADLMIPSAELKLPVKQLLTAKALKTSGAKRGTRYHVGSRSAPKAPAAAPAKAAVVPGR